MNEFTHHSPDNELGRLAGCSEAFAEAFAPSGFVERGHGGHVKGFAQEGVPDLGQTRLTLDAAAGDRKSVV